MKYFFIIVCWLGLYQTAQASLRIHWHKGDAIFFHGIHAGIGLPTHGINGRLQPGIGVGYIRQTKHQHLLWEIALAYTAQQSLQRSFYVQPGISYQYKIKNMAVDAGLHMAAMFVKQTNDEFVWQSTGTYQSVSAYRFQYMPSLHLGIQYPVYSTAHFKYSIHGRYAFGIQYPFSELSAFLPINQFQLGLSIKKK